MPPADEQAGPRLAIKSHDWRIIRIMLEDEPRKSAAGIYNQIVQPGYPAVPADFLTSSRWHDICARLRIAAAIGDNDPTPQQSEHLFNLVDEAADEFKKFSDGSPAASQTKRKPDDAPDFGPARKRRKTIIVKRVYASWDELRGQLDELLALITRDISVWLSGEQHLPVWEPPRDSSWHLPEHRAALDHVISLHLPRTPAAASGPCLADLLLYKLGESEELDPGFTQKKERVMEGNAHQVIANVSGAGKTRLSLEVLADDWSFYFMAHYDAVVNPYGSQDVMFALRDLEDSTDASGNNFCPDVAMTRDGQGVRAPDGFATGRNNAAMARQIFAAVALARVLVHNQFLQAYSQLSPAHRDKLHGPRLWLLLQVSPALNGRDIFQDVYRVLRSLSTEDLDDEIIKCYAQWKHQNHSIARVALDEVQYLVDTFPNAFVGTKVHGIIPTRPVFKPVMVTLSTLFLQRSMPGTRFLLAGTQLCVASAFNAVVSTAVKNAAVVESSVTAANFDMKPGTTEFDPAPIIRYLSHFLSDAVVASFGNLMHDIIFWLRGRPRFLAYFVQWVLQKGPHAARDVLLNIVSKLTGVALNVCVGPGVPVADITEMQLRPLLSTTLMRESENLRMKNGSLTDTCRTIVRALLNLLIEGRYTRIDYFHEKLVELGVGKFEESTSSCWIRENLVLARLFAYFSTDEGHETFIRTINDGLEHPTRSVSGFAFENALIWLFWRLFTTSTPTLASFLKFFGPSSDSIPAWAHRRAHLVWYFDGDTPVFASPNFAVGLAATGAKPLDALSWLRNETRLPFFKPDTYLGPDVCLRLAIERSVPNTYDIITLCLQGKYGDADLSELALRKAVYTASPEHFYTAGNTASRDAILESFPRWQAAVTSSQDDEDGDGSDDDDDYGDGDGDDDDDDALSTDSSVPEGRAKSDVVFDYTVPTPPDLALLRVLATTKNVKKFVETAGGLGTYPLAHVPLTTFYRAASDFRLSGFKAALEAADASLARSYAGGSRPLTRSMMGKAGD